jgi:hypothetical protein
MSQRKKNVLDRKFSQCLQALAYASYDSRFPLSGLAQWGGRIISWSAEFGKETRMMCNLTSCPSLVISISLWEIDLLLESWQSYISERSLIVFLEGISFNASTTYSTYLVEVGRRPPYDIFVTRKNGKRRPAKRSTCRELISLLIQCVHWWPLISVIMKRGRVRVDK